MSCGLNCDNSETHLTRPSDTHPTLQRRFGPEFNLGGLAGLPFTGKTGFGAFAAHVPKDGHIFIVYAPHVGISRDGEIGYYHREGQLGATTSCGACIGDYSSVTATSLTLAVQNVA